MGSALKKVLDLTDTNEKFRQLCLYYGDLLALEGKKVKPFRSADLPVFSTLTVEQKRNAIDFIGTALEIFEETRAEGFKLGDSPKLMWRAIRKLGWTPQSDIFDRIFDGDVLTIYSARQIQVFQNLNFFDWVTLTLEDLYAAPWHVYSRRVATAAELLYQNGVEIFTGVRTATYDPKVPEHYCEELGTEGLSKFYIKVQWLSPLKQGGQVAGVLVVNRCRPWDGVPCTAPLL